MEDLLGHHSATPVTRSWVLTALVKLTARLQGAEGDRVEALIGMYQSSVTVELQQR
ncbi:unnamed protein product [Discosporangium mesarthrocarpum]